MVRTIAAITGMPVPEVSAYARAVNPALPWTTESVARLLIALVAAPTPATARLQARKVGAFRWLRAVGVSRAGTDYDPALFVNFARPLVNLLVDVIDELRRSESGRPVARIERLAVTAQDGGGVIAQLEGTANADGRQMRVVLEYADEGVSAEDLAATGRGSTRAIPGSTFYAVAKALGPLGRRPSDRSAGTSPATVH